MTKQTKKKITPARWEKTTDGWKIIWGKEDKWKGRIWPSKCPKCGKELEAHVSGVVGRIFAVKEDGELEPKGEDDIELFYENPTFHCTDWKKCGFEYEVED